MPYFAPDYFAPSYFASIEGGVVTSEPTKSGPYFAPSYFAPGYFGGLGAVAPVVVVEPDPPWVSVRDKTILEDVRERLWASEQFEIVAAASPSQDPHQASASRPLALVGPVSASEDDAWADLWVRTLRFQVTIVTQAEEQLDRHDALDLLGNFALQAVQNRALAGVTLPAKTRIAEQRYGAIAHPDQSLVLVFNAVYFISPDPGHDLTS